MATAFQAFKDVRLPLAKLCPPADRALTRAGRGLCSKDAGVGYCLSRLGVRRSWRAPRGSPRGATSVGQRLSSSVRVQLLLYLGQYRSQQTPARAHLDLCGHYSSEDEVTRLTSQSSSGFLVRAARGAARSRIDTVLSSLLRLELREVKISPKKFAAARLEFPLINLQLKLCLKTTNGKACWPICG